MPNNSNEKIQLFVYQKKEAVQRPTGLTIVYARIFYAPALKIIILNYETGENKSSNDPYYLKQAENIVNETTNHETYYIIRKPIELSVDKSKFESLISAVKQFESLQHEINTGIERILNNK